MSTFELNKYFLDSAGLNYIFAGLNHIFASLNHLSGKTGFRQQKLNPVTAAHLLLIVLQS